MDYPKRTVIFLSGSFCPIHKGHIEALRESQNYCKDLGIELVKTFIVPNHQDYVNSKLRNNEFKLPRRLSIIKRAIKGTDIELSEVDTKALEHRSRVSWAQTFADEYNCQPIILGGEDSLDRYTPGLHHIGHNWYYIVKRDDGISSTLIRDRMAKKKKKKLEFEI